jgi:hypothetical protein
MGDSQTSTFSVPASNAASRLQEQRGGHIPKTRLIGIWAGHRLRTRLPFNGLPILEFAVRAGAPQDVLSSRIVQTALRTNK